MLRSKLKKCKKNIPQKYKSINKPSVNLKKGISTSATLWKGKFLKSLNRFSNKRRKEKT